MPTTLAYITQRGGMANLMIEKWYSILFILCFSECSSYAYPRKSVVCYYEGKRSYATLNACFCTHLIYTSIGIDEYAKLQISEGKNKSIKYSITEQWGLLAWNFDVRFGVFLYLGTTKEASKHGNQSTIEIAPSSNWVKKTTLQFYSKMLKDRWRELS